MSLTPPQPVRRDSVAAPVRLLLIQWTIVQAGLWVGKANGEFAGMIETAPEGGFVAMSKFAGPLGTFATIDEAKASFSD